VSITLHYYKSLPYPNKDLTIFLFSESLYSILYFISTASSKASLNSSSDLVLGA